MGIADRVRMLAEKNGYTIAHLEREMGFSQGSIRNWNKAAPSADKLYKVSKFFNVTMEYILTGIEQVSAQQDVSGISEDGLEVGALWDQLDKPGRSIILGKIYERLEEIYGDGPAAGHALKQAQ